MFHPFHSLTQFEIFSSRRMKPTLTPLSTQNEFVLQLDFTPHHPDLSYASQS